MRPHGLHPEKGKLLPMVQHNLWFSVQLSRWGFPHLAFLWTTFRAFSAAAEVTQHCIPLPSVLWTCLRCPPPSSRISIAVVPETITIKSCLLALVLMALTTAHKNSPVAVTWSSQRSFYCPEAFPELKQIHTWCQFSPTGSCDKNPSIPQSRTELWTMFSVTDFHHGT